MKCPECSTPYSVETKDIQSHQPSFDCFSCSTRFHFLWPQPFRGVEIPTYSLPKLEDVEDESALSQSDNWGFGPSLGVYEELFDSTREVVAPLEEPDGFREDGEKSLKPQAEESPSPKVRESLELKSKISSTASSGGEEEGDLQALWTELLKNWEDELWHQSFLSACDRKARLSFASGRYSQYVHANPGDEMGKKMKERLRALSGVDLVHAHKTSKSTGPRKSTPKESRIVGLLEWWWPICLVMCLILFMVGYTQPLYRNLIGLSLAMGVGVSGLKYFFFQDKN